MAKNLILLLAIALYVQAAPPRTIAEATKDFEKMDGFVPMYWDKAEGKVFLQINHWNREFLYIASLPAGLGSNDIGLDRGLLSQPRVVVFERIGPRVLLVQKNSKFRASSENPMEKRAVADSFATSVLWGFDVAATDGDGVLVDASEFFQRDTVGAADAIKNAKEGTYRVDPKRCAFFLERTKNFPSNSEVEVILTLSGEPTGRHLGQVSPDSSITLREHHSMIELPDGDFQPRAYDPRAGYFDMTYRDYSAALGDDIDKRLIVRHRITPTKPITYYVDGGAPDDVRQALMDGAAWWNQAFEAAGFPNGFQVKVLPADVDPMDVRYNIVQWVHRYTRGWSYGNAIADPRTGEIMKGQVTLGSLRYRQDYLIFSSLLSPFGADSGGLLGQVKDAVYARLRQLAAHEIGHTLGLAHNYVASTHDRASVMDYPHPYINLGNDGALDLKNAYATGIGSWDKVAIRYGYTKFPAGTDEKKALDQIILDAAHEGNIFISDADSRPLGSAHPRAHLWDNGPNAVDELARLLKIRHVALEHFGENSIPTGSPWSNLDETLVPLYFLHRYQTEAAAKVLGGVDYAYALRGDGQIVTEIVPAAEQKRAQEMLLQTVSAFTLTLPERIVKLVAPHPPGFDRTRESFPEQTGLTFDPVAAAQASAGITGSLLFQRERAARLVEHHARNAAYPALEDVIRQVAAATWLAAKPAGLAGEVKTATDLVLFEQALILANDGNASPVVRSKTIETLASLRLPGYLARRLQAFERAPEKFQPAAIAEAPPGQPIGEEECARPILPVMH